MKQFILLILLAILSISAFSQVGVGTTDPNSAAALHIYDNGGGKGVLIPAVDDLTVIDGNLKGLSADEQEQAVGMTVFLTTNNRFYTWDGTDWICLSPFTATADPDNYSNSDPNITLSEPYETLEAELRGNFEGTGKLNGDFTGSVNSTFNGYGSVPVGGILMWSGSEIPEGFLLCDGACYNLDGTLFSRNSTGCHYGSLDHDLIMTPNLSGRFVVGYGPSAPYNYNDPGSYSEAVRDSTDQPDGAGVGGRNTVSLTETQVAPHEHDVIEYAHKHSITGEIMQKDGSSTKQVVAIDTRADVGHGDVTYNNKIGATITGVQVKRGGGIYTYDEIPNPPYRIPTCNVWQYTCTTIYNTTFQASRNLMINGTQFGQTGTSVDFPSAPGINAYEVCMPGLSICYFGYTNKFVGSSFEITGCTQNSDYDSSNPQCLSEHHDPSVPVGETIRINEEWSVEGHENRPPYFVIAFIMRFK